MRSGSVGPTRIISIIFTKPFVAALAAGVLGFAANGYEFPVFGGTSLVFGGFFSLLIAFTLGPWYAAITAAIAFSRTLAEWQHPVAIVCFCFEAIFVGWLVQRRSWQHLNAVAIYWIAIGFPVACVWLVKGSTVPFPLNWAIALKFPANSLITGLGASLVNLFAIQVWPSLTSRGPKKPVSLQGMLFHRFGVIAAMPIVVLSFLAGHQFDQSRRDQVTRELAAGVQEMARSIERHVDTHRRSIETLAQKLAAGADTSPLALHRELESIRAAYPGFRTLLIADQSGRILAAAAPAAPTPGEIPATDRDISDREYFRVPLATGRSFVSDVFQGRGLGHDLIVAVSVPVVGADHAVAFVVEGSLNLNAISDEIARAGALPGSDIVVSDRKHRVVVGRGSYANLEPLAFFNRSSLFEAANSTPSNTFYHDGWNPDRGRNERYAAAAALMPDLGWHVYLQQPVWHIQKLIAQFYLTTLCWAAVGITAALILARITTLSVTRPLSALLSSTRALSARHPDQPLPALDSADVPQELAQLSSDVHSAARHLRQSSLELELMLAERERSNAELRDVLRTLDAKVAERTAELQEARTAAESANQSKGDFLASMSHELRTPLNVILGMNELLNDAKLGELSARQLECTRSIEESGRHLLSLINDILDLTKIEAGKLQIELQPVSIRDVCESSLRMVQSIAVKKKLRLTCAYQQSDHVVSADPRRLKQILVNLLSNAAKFTPEGGAGGIIVSQEKSPPSIVFTVWDTGIGISPENLDKLFRPFVQIDSALSRRYNGTGLGLALVKRMVQMHGGIIEVKSTPHEGSRFCVRLPSRATEASTAATTPAPVHRGRRTPIPGSPLILLAEDNAANIALIENFAETRGCRTILAHTGVAAIARAKADAPDLILMDVQMPEMDGLQATQELRRDPQTRHIPIICVTANALAGDRERCLAAGASAYVSKPINLEHLASLIVSLLPARRALPAVLPS